MRLVLKLTAAFLFVVVVVIAVHETIRVRHEIVTFEEDMDRDHEVVGHALADAAAALYEKGEKDKAHLIVQQARPSTRLKIRWVCEPGTDRDAKVSCAELAKLSTATPLKILDPAADGLATRYSYVRLPTEVFQGALEVSEPTKSEQEYIRDTVQRTLLTAGLAVVLCTGLAFALGVWLVARPTRRLVAKAREVGRGELGEPLDIRQKDEIGQLGAEMNLMCDRLAEARRTRAEETAARIAAVEQLRHADRLRTVGTLASGVAHELGTPLNVIEARASMIAEDPSLDEPVRKSGRVMLECSERITRIIRQLLVFAREKKIERASVDLEWVVGSSLELLRTLASKRNIDIELRSEEPIKLEVDSVLLQQAITNLVMNAVQASAPGGRVEVALSSTRASHPEARKQARYARIEVIDQGNGIAQQDFDRLFEPFFTTKPPGEGTGLGLSVAYGIVKEHDGFIDVRSEPGRGATFSVYLPWEGAS